MEENDVINIKKENAKLELITVKMKLSETSKKRFLDNPSEFMKEQLEREGFIVNEVIISKDEAIEITRDELFFPTCDYVHISYYPDKPKLVSKYIKVRGVKWKP
jgi:hypothetical protein